MGPARADFSELERRGRGWVTSQPSTLLLSANEWLKDLDRRVSRVAERRILKNHTNGYTNTFHSNYLLGVSTMDLHRHKQH